MSPTMKEKHPEVFAEDQDANPRQHKRVIPMEVLSLGMSRTGTASKFFGRLTTKKTDADIAISHATCSQHPWLPLLPWC